MADSVEKGISRRELILGAVGALTAGQIAGRIEARVGSRTLAPFTNLAFMMEVLSYLEKQPLIENIIAQAQVAKSYPFDLIDIPGAGINPDDNPVTLDNDSWMRLLALKRLAEAQVAPVGMIHGSPDPQSHSEPVATVMGKAFRKISNPDYFLAIDETSHNTVTTAVKLAAFQRMFNVSSIVAVTSPDHILGYALDCFSQGIPFGSIYFYSADEIVKYSYPDKYQQLVDREHQIFRKKWRHELLRDLYWLIDPKYYTERLRDGDIKFPWRQP